MPDFALREPHRSYRRRDGADCFLFALGWRGNQIETRTGRYPWKIGIPLWLYVAALAVGAYVLVRTPTLTTSRKIFVAAAVGEFSGGIVVYAILNALFFTRGQGIENRLGPIVVALMLTVGLIAAAFQ